MIHVLPLLEWVQLFLNIRVVQNVHAELAQKNCNDILSAGTFCIIDNLSLCTRHAYYQIIMIEA